MSSQRTFVKILFSVVALVLMLHISFSLISASPAEAFVNNAPEEDAQIAALTQQVETLTQMMTQLSAREQHILVLRIEQQCFGGAATVQSVILQIPVEKSFFDICMVGDDITESSQIRLLSSSLLTETRVYVEDKFITVR